METIHSNKSLYSSDVDIIGLCGQSQSGKDTLAQLLEKDSGWKHFAFADALKGVCMDYLGLSRDDVYTQDGKARFNEFWGMTNREILQRVGTEAMRNGFEKDVWVKIAELKASKMVKEGKKIILTDCRFANEAEMVYRLGGIVVEVSRKGVDKLLTESERKHKSENRLPDKYIAFTVNNDRTIPWMLTDFSSKFDFFIKRQQGLVEGLSAMLKKGETQFELASRVAFFAKSFFRLPIRTCHPYSDHAGELHMTLDTVGKYMLSLYTDSKNDSMLFYVTERRVDDVYVEYKKEFKIDDRSGWLSVTDYIVSLRRN